MINKNRKTSVLLFLGVVLGMILVGAIFIFGGNIAKPSFESVGDQTTGAAQAPTSVWNALMEATPFAYFTPLPEAVPSAVDGTYAKVDQSWPQWWRCLRCADYRLAGGIWKLQFDKGVMRIFYEVNNWRSIASFIVSADRLFIFNDPYCPETTGEYKWAVVDGQLKLEVVDDPCSFDLRAENLGKQGWQSCASTDQPNTLTSDGGLVPGCGVSQDAPASVIQVEPPLSVVVYGGDSRFFEKPPELIVHANAADMQPPDGIQISYSDESIPYGLHRVLWWNGEWIEVSFDGSFDALGVQFLGEQAIGWARVLFDGEEVWRGNTSAIWSKLGRHGGFVEISGFGEGTHILRVESLGFDYRPVTVASFGFSYDGGVQPGNP